MPAASVVWPARANSSATRCELGISYFKFNEQESTLPLAAKAGTRLLHAAVQQYLARAVLLDPALCGAWLGSLIQKAEVRG